MKLIKTKLEGIGEVYIPETNPTFKILEMTGSDVIELHEGIPLLPHHIDQPEPVFIRIDWFDPTEYNRIWTQGTVFGKLLRKRHEEAMNVLHKNYFKLDSGSGHFSYEIPESMVSEREIFGETYLVVDVDGIEVIFNVK